ncbi:Gr9a [Drosophila busckii]|uniref:Gustatory receptor n=1 Tax=Drosophila busckii TaxID=30019 RepID=A0A0M4FAF7_DROBS|nr:Gr9a [Drosophila busckii]
MSRRTERYLGVYFRLLALSACLEQRAGQSLLSAYLSLVLGDGLYQVYRYSQNSWQMNDFRLEHRMQLKSYVKIIDAMNVAYLLTHLLMVSLALLWRHKERRLLAQLPALTERTRPLINTNLHLVMECLVSGSAVMLCVLQANTYGLLLSNLRYIYCTQAVRARYLQMALLVERLDAQLLQLQQQLAAANEQQQQQRCWRQLRCKYAHIVKVSRQLSQLYGPALLWMNALCIGDFIVVCYVIIVLRELTEIDFSWLMLWQSIYVMLPTLMKIWTLCSTCNSCVRRTQRLLWQVNNASYLATARPGVVINAHLRSLCFDFTLQIMQSPLEFNICSIYQLNLQTLAGMFIFIVESLVIFLQFVALSKQTN